MVIFLSLLLTLPSCQNPAASSVRTHSGKEVTHISVSGNGKMIACAKPTDEGTRSQVSIDVLDASSMRPMANVIIPAGEVASLLFSGDNKYLTIAITFPDGPRLIRWGRNYLQHWELLLWDIERKRTCQSHKFDIGDGLLFDSTIPNSFIVYTKPVRNGFASPWTAFLYNFKTSTKSNLVSVPQNCGLDDFALSSDGTAFVYTNSDGTTRYRREAGVNSEKVLPAGAGPLWYPVLSNSGELLAGVEEDQSVFLINTANGKKRRLTRGRLDDNHYVTLGFSKDGRYMYLLDFDVIQQWDTLNFCQVRSIDCEDVMSNESTLVITDEVLVYGRESGGFTVVKLK